MASPIPVLQLIPLVSTSAQPTGKSRLLIFHSAGQSGKVIIGRAEDGDDERKEGIKNCYFKQEQGTDLMIDKEQAEVWSDGGKVSKQLVDRLDGRKFQFTVNAWLCFISHSAFLDLYQGFELIFWDLLKLKSNSLHKFPKHLTGSKFFGRIE
jgi:hypothetical protein